LSEGGSVVKLEEKRNLGRSIISADLFVDALLGTGFSLPLRGSAKDALEAVHHQLEKMENPPFVVAVDCPSGLDCDSGDVAEACIPADLTVTLAAVEPGLIRFPGSNFTGEIVVGDIGLPDKQKLMRKIKLEFATANEIRKLLPERPGDGHKGTFGTILVVGGSINYPGAVGLCGMGAYRVGAGLVTLAVPSPIQGHLVPLIPEATWIVLPHELGAINEGAADILHREMARITCLVIGPGMGMEKTTGMFMDKFLSANAEGPRERIGFITEAKKDGGETVSYLPPFVIDADGLKLLNDIDAWSSRIPEKSILTPHPGEMAVLTDESISEIQDDRIASALKWAKVWGHIVVLKGAHTVVASPDGRATVMPFASSALAHAGTGDVLAGAISGFRAQGIEPYEAAVLGAFIHGNAGLLAADFIGAEEGVLASEVADAIPMALWDIRSD
jgi:NAD(P)H-hydrate epimerase